eukprot:s7081_g1.t1
MLAVIYGILTVTCQLFIFVSVEDFNHLAGCSEAKPPDHPPWRDDQATEALAATEPKAPPRVHITPAVVKFKAASAAAKPSAAPTVASPEVEEEVKPNPGGEESSAMDAPPEEPQNLEEVLQHMLRNAEEDEIMILGLHYLVLVVTIESDESGNWLVVTQIGSL